MKLVYRTGKHNVNTTTRRVPRDSIFIRSMGNYYKLVVSETLRLMN